MKSNLIVVQPVLASYRKTFLVDLNRYFSSVRVYANLKVGNGFKSDVVGSFRSVHTPVIGNRLSLYYQTGLLTAPIKKDSAAIFITADFRAIHFWLVLILGRVLGVPVFSHGQGLYDKPNTGIIRRLLFRVVLGLSSSYVCYTESVRQSLLAVGMSAKKISVMENTLVNEFPVPPIAKKSPDRLLFVGRLREGSNLDLLFDAMELLKTDRVPVALDVIGDGVLKDDIVALAKRKDLDVHFYGSIYDDEKISQISKHCGFGVYPGDAGLSLVHYMSLSLIPIVHGALDKHMGPEPSYIKHGVNGLFFDRGDANSLAHTISSALGDENRSAIKTNAYNTYVSLSKPSMAEKLMVIMKPHLKS